VISLLVAVLLVILLAVVADRLLGRQAGLTVLGVLLIVVLLVVADRHDYLLR
jgi:hypothetical protein